MYDLIPPQIDCFCLLKTLNNYTVESILSVDNQSID